MIDLAKNCCSGSHTTGHIRRRLIGRASTRRRKNSSFCGRGKRLEIQRTHDYQESCPDNKGDLSMRLNFTKPTRRTLTTIAIWSIALATSLALAEDVWVKSD